MIQFPAPTSYLKVTKWAGLIAVALCCLTVAACSSRPADVHKFVSPGIYQVYLTKGLKRVYYFWVWTSKDIRVPSVPDPHAVLQDENGTNLTMKASRVHFFTETYRMGDLIGFYQIERTGVYRFTGSTKGVFVICGQEEMYDDLGSNTVFSRWNDDSCFEQPAMSSLPRTE